MKVSLLDVNMLVALSWPSHIHHAVAQDWFTANYHSGWATCPITQTAFVRISSNPRIIRDAVEPLEAITLLKRIVAIEYHVFWSDVISIDDKAVPTALLAGHNQVVDAYLLGLCIHHEGRLVTLDRDAASLLPRGTAIRDVIEVVVPGSN